MCGFVGFLDPRGLEADAEGVVRAMADRLRHRGPDDEGQWLDPAAGIALGHRRLAIVDLSAAGHQPMVSASGRYVLAFNGEIYNHEALRSELGGRSPEWRGHSDTETLLACVDAWGLERSLRRAVGMFALALWDRGRRELLLARDRVGEKPCYYGWHGGTLLFASELTALRAHPHFRFEVDPAALALYFRHGYVPAPHGIARGTAKVAPGTIARFAAGSAPGDAPSVDRYWSLQEVAERGRAEPFEGSEPEAVDRLEALLGDAVARQRMADVPLGAFLSGGVDSSTVVALMQARARRPVKTFTIGFAERTHDESHHARAVAEHLGTDHTELLLTPEDAVQALGTLPAVYDEPFADPSALPTHLVCRLARGHVTVSLSGDGGDELFGGYSRYHRADRVWQRLRPIPAVARRALAGGMGLVPARAIGSAMASLRIGRHPHLFAERSQTLRATLASHSVARLYRDQMSLWRRPGEVVLPEVREPATHLMRFPDWTEPFGTIERLMVTDTLTYLPDDILVKVDRAAMAVSLETRVPLLDPDVIAFAWSLPRQLRVRGGSGKWLLRQVLARHVPAPIVDRPKMGFGVPVGRWIRGPLRPWAEALLAPAALQRSGLLRVPPVRRRWREHLAGTHDWSFQLWPVLVFQQWLEAHDAP